MEVGPFLIALGLGLRHGIDWDHLAAIADLSSSAVSRRRGFVLSFLYAVGHGAVVFAVGIVVVTFGASLPSGLDDWMGRVVGFTFLALGLWMTLDLLRRGRSFRLRSRWGLILTGAQRAIRHQRQPAMVGPGVAEIDREDPPSDAGSTTAAGIGVLHGIGVESPTQIAVFAASSSAAGFGAGVGLLGAWVVGLVVANTLIAAVAAFGLLEAQRHAVLYLTVSGFVAAASLVYGALLVAGVDVLPAIV